MKKNRKKLLIAGAILAAGIFIFSRRYRIKRVALSFHDVEEIGNNAGFNNAVFEEMMQNAGWNSGEQWCMYYVKAIYDTVAPRLKSDFAKSLGGSSQQSFFNVEAGKSKHLQVIKEGRPRVGDIVIWQNYANPGKGHAGIIVKVTNGGRTFTTVEGNTYEPGVSSNNEIVAVVPGHKNEIGQKSNIYPSKKLRGFIRLK